MAVIAIMRTAEAWSVDRRGGITAFVRMKDASNKNNNNNNKEFMKTIASEEGASYLMMTDMLDDPKRMKIEIDIENMMRASNLKKMSDTFTTAEDNAAIEVESSSVAAIEKSQQAKKPGALDVESISSKRDSAG